MGIVVARHNRVALIKRLREGVRQAAADVMDLAESGQRDLDSARLSVIAMRYSRDLFTLKATGRKSRDVR